MIRLAFMTDRARHLVTSIPETHADLVSGPHVARSGDGLAAALERFAASAEELVVTGDADTLRAFLPHASQLDVLISEEPVEGSSFDDWNGGAFREVSETPLPRGRVIRYARTAASGPEAMDAFRMGNAVGLYMEGIRDGLARQAVEAYTGDRYTQHSTGVKDGREGFIEFFSAFLDRTPEREIVPMRGWVDGRHMFVHVYQRLNGGEAEWVTTDFFDTDEDGKIVEHWDVIAPYAATTPSGHTSVDGSGTITDLDKTEANKQLVRAMIENVLMPEGEGSLSDYISTDQYLQHNAEVPDGLEAFQALLTPERPLWYDEIVLLMGRGNFVSVLSKTRWEDKPYAQVDVFRIEDGKIVEHWDAAEPCPPADELANSGKF